MRLIPRRETVNINDLVGAQHINTLIRFTRDRNAVLNFIAEQMLDHLSVSRAGNLIIDRC